MISGPEPRRRRLERRPVRQVDVRLLEEHGAALADESERRRKPERGRARWRPPCIIEERRLHYVPIFYHSSRSSYYHAPVSLDRRPELHLLIIAISLPMYDVRTRRTTRSNLAR